MSEREAKLDGRRCPRRHLVSYLTRY